MFLFWSVIILMTPFKCWISKVKSFSWWSGSRLLKKFHAQLNWAQNFKCYKTKIPTNEKVSCSKSLGCCIYHASKCLNTNNCWHFNIYEQDKFCAQLSRAWKKFIISGPGLTLWGGDLGLFSLSLSLGVVLTWLKYCWQSLSFRLDSIKFMPRLRTAKLHVLSFWVISLWFNFS